MHAPAGKRLGEIFVDDEPLEDDRIYSLAAGNRVGAPHSNIHRVRGCQAINLLGCTTHDAVESYLRRHSPIRYEGALSLRCTDRPGVLRSQFLPEN